VRRNRADVILTISDEHLAFILLMMVSYWLGYIMGERDIRVNEK
jgi:hypothetical protein